MGFPAYLLGLSLPLLGGIALGFFVMKMMQVENQQQGHRNSSHKSGPNWNYANSRTAQNYNNDVCPVCLEPMEPGNSQEFACGHKVHNTCLVELFERKMNNCPQCRAKIF